MPDAVCTVDSLPPRTAHPLPIPPPLHPVRHTLVCPSTCVRWTCSTRRRCRKQVGLNSMACMLHSCLLWGHFQLGTPAARQPPPFPFCLPQLHPQVIVWPIACSAATPVPQARPASFLRLLRRALQWAHPWPRGWVCQAGLCPAWQTCCARWGTLWSWAEHAQGGACSAAASCASRHVHMRMARRPHQTFAQQ